MPIWVWDAPWRNPAGARSRSLSCAWQWKECRDREETHYWLGKTLIQAGQKPAGEKELAEVEKLNRVKRQTASEILNQAVSPTAGHKNP